MLMSTYVIRFVYYNYVSGLLQHNNNQLHVYSHSQRWLAMQVS